MSKNKNILVLHSNYGSSAPSGENVSVSQQIKFLKSTDMNVIDLDISSDKFMKQRFFLFKTLIRFLFSFENNKILNFIKNNEINYVVIHNIFPHINNSIYKNIKNINSNIKIVQWIHNYRRYCINGLGILNGVDCTFCRDKPKIIFPLKNKCYRKSYFLSILLIFTKYYERSFINPWQYVDQFVGPSIYVGNLVLSAKENNKFIHKDNMLDMNLPKLNCFNERQFDVAFIGRFGIEKGVNEFINALDAIRDIKLNIVFLGGGDLQGMIENFKLKTIHSISILPTSDIAEVYRILNNSKILCVPSNFSETFCRVLYEGVMNQCIPLTTNIGAQNEFAVRYGLSDLTINPNNYKEMASKIKLILEDVEFYSNRVDYIRRIFLNKFSDFSQALFFHEIFS